jgi:hypothetical protein
MNDIYRLLSEIRTEVFKAVVLETFLDSCFIFLLSFLILSIINFHPLLATIMFVASFAYLAITRMKGFRLRSVEDRNPVIREMLRTAADNVNSDNFVIRALNSELITRMRHVATSSLMKLNRIVYKLIGIAVLAMLIIYVSATQFMLFDLNKLISTGFSPVVKEGSVEDIYGQKTDVPALGSNPVDIKLNPLSYEINIDKINEAQPKEFKSDFPMEVYASQENSYEENIPKEQQVIVKNYFASILT